MAATLFSLRSPMAAVLLLLLLSVADLTSSQISPSPPPGEAPASSPTSPSLPPALLIARRHSPPAPPLPEPSLASSPAPAPANKVIHAANGKAVETETPGSENGSGGGGMSGGKKAGVVVGVVAAVAIVWVGVVVYKKRQENIRRSRYRYDTTREFL